MLADGNEIEVVDGTGAGDQTKINNGTAIQWKATDSTVDQMKNLAAAITSNAALNTKYTAVAATNALTLTQKAGEESATGPVMQTSNSVGCSLEATFRIGANSIRVHH